MCSAGSVNWSASSPKPGMFAVQPTPVGSKSPKVIFSASPGSAPSTKTGPVTGLTLEKSSVATSAAVLPGVKCPFAASLHSKRSVVPGAIRSTGGIELSQP